MNSNGGSPVTGEMVDNYNPGWRNSTEKVGECRGSITSLGETEKICLPSYKLRGPEIELSAEKISTGAIEVNPCMGRDVKKVTDTQPQDTLKVLYCNVNGIAKKKINNEYWCCVKQQ